MLAPLGGSRTTAHPSRRALITFPEHALLILEERLREREEQDGLEPPAGMDQFEMALRMLCTVEYLTRAEGVH